jgi:hypothetical protein
MRAISGESSDETGGVAGFDLGVRHRDHNPEEVRMKTTFSRFVLAGALLAATTASAGTALQKHSFGTVKGTACVGPISPSMTDGVQIVGSTTGAKRLTWQVYSTSSETADALVFEVTAKSVDEVIPPEGNLLYYGCVAKTTGMAQAYDLQLNSEEL